MILECLDCGALFDEDACLHRAAEAEDGRAQESPIECCPHCRSIALEDADTCTCCGEPIRHDRHGVCDECAEKIDRIIIYAAHLIMADHKGLSIENAVEVLASRAEQIDVTNIEEE